MNDKIKKLLSLIECGLCIAIAAISLLACIPKAKTYAGQNIFKTAGLYINKNSANFFFLNLLLAVMAILCFAARWYVVKYKSKLNVDSVLEIQRKGIAKIEDQCNQLRLQIYETDKQFSLEKPENLRIAESQNSRVKYTLIQIEGVYKDNLRNYYDTNLKIYAIVKKTQLIQINEIKDLLDQYGKLT